MVRKEYTSFEEIDMDLQILELERQIDKEQLKLTIQEAKNSLYPTSLMGGVGGIAQKLLLTFLAKKLAERFS